MEESQYLTDSSHFRYWGKADPQYPGDPKWHPLVYHSLDVAAVGVAYLRRARPLRRLFVAALGGEDGLDSWVAFWLALHDLGKFTEAFQGQRADLLQTLQGRHPEKTYTVRHDSLGWQLWQGLICRKIKNEGWFGSKSEDLLDGLDWWMRAVAGHHGQPPNPDGLWETSCHRREDRAAVTDFAAQMRGLLLDDAALALPTRMDVDTFIESSREMSWWMAGLAVLADWIGSNSRYFPYQKVGQPLCDYWEEVLDRAEAAVEDCGVLASRSCAEITFGALFPVIAQPSPLQRWASDHILPEGQQLYFLEDVTGAGKTEAAVMLAHRLMAQDRVEGFFIGLPTMATANAMYGRIADIYRRLFEDETSLALAHGNRQFVEAFAGSVLPLSKAETDQAQQDDTASASCTAWLADHNKRALLAPAGVGTLDQALLAVLQSRHQSLRLLGLARKALVVDEVHACDAYMLGVLCVLLEFQARSGGSAILLSATLPTAMKRKLLAAFARGCGYSAVPTSGEMAYPLASNWAASTPQRVNEVPLTTRSAVERRIAVRSVAQLDEVFRTINATLDQGRCVCWIRNTVADALEAYELFRATVEPSHLLLFHARFALQDRLAIEDRVIEQFGPTSSSADRAGRLLIATQVVEQSLDLDFDLVISDLAPIDRLIQRAGRLCRHVRDARGTRLAAREGKDQRGEPCLVVFGPSWTETPAADWFKSAFPKAAAVYPNHGQIWLSAKALKTGVFTMPQDVRALIEDVFGQEASIPDALQGIADKDQAKGFADASLAQANTIKFSAGYVSSAMDWWSEALTPSRLGEATMNVVLARWQGDVLKPWARHREQRHAWTYSAVRIAERLIAQAVQPVSTARQEAVRVALDSLPGKGRWSVLLPLEETSSGWMAEALSAAKGDTAGRRLRWIYDRATGLQLNQNEEDR